MRRLSERQIAAIQADVDTTAAELGRQHGVSDRMIRYYRKDARQERREIARDVLEKRVEAEMPNALDDLAALRAKAREVYEGSAAAKDGALWLASIKTTLDYLGNPSDDDLDAAIEDGLAALSGNGKTPDAEED